jgi:hypothetical protein
MPHPYQSQLRALEASLLAKLNDRDWDNCRQTLRRELADVRATIQQVANWTDTSAQEQS